MASEEECEKPDFSAFRARLRYIAEFELAKDLRSLVDPSDVVQDALLKAHRSRDQLEGDAFCWLRAILANTIATARRDHMREKRDFRRQESLDAALDESSDRFVAVARDGATPSEQAERVELFVRIAELVSGLAEDQRQAFVLRHWHDLPLEEIAERLEKSRAAVAGLLRRGMAQVRDALA